MRPVRTKSLTSWVDGGPSGRILLWFGLSLALSIAFFRDFWVSLPTMLSPDWVLGQYHAASWGVLVLCLIFLWVKRKEVWRGMNGGGTSQGLKATLGAHAFNLQFVVGMAVVAGAVLMPSSTGYLVFQVLLASLGVFIILFGMGARIPSILLAIYGFTISFPLVVQQFAENAYSRTAIVPLMGVMTALGYPLQNEGQWVNMTSSGGESILVAVTAACAGPTTMGVFLALFALMALDMPLPAKKAAKLFLFGVVGTWFQSFIRLVFLMLVAYYRGEDAMWTAHFWTIYILFPLWYLLFAYLYFRQVGRPPRVGGNQRPGYVLARGV